MPAKTTNQNKNMNVTINDHKTGKALAHNVAVDGQILNANAQMPEGVLQAGVLLSDCQIEKIAAKHNGFSANTTIYCD